MWTNREKKSYLFISKNWENKSLERENKKNELNGWCGHWCGLTETYQQ